MTRRPHALDIDFQRPAREMSPRRGWVGLLAGIALLAAAQAEYTGADQALAAAREHAQEGRPDAQGAPAQRPQDAARAAAEAGVRAQLGTRWSELFTAVEGAAGADVALLELQANPATGAVRVTGEARNFASLVAYVRSMEAAPALARVTLAGHETRRDHPQHPVRFTLTATWEAGR